ncbi:MAG: WYL domain-containing protein [Sideroxyarcus sp.]|nr:WYL domain-containing protein [Sideroxyarcus sp.]
MLLKWEGRLANARLRELFGLAHTRSSETIREFREAHPRWTLWDPADRCYYATNDFYRQLQDEGVTKLSDSLARYLALVGLAHANSPEAEQSVILAAFPELLSPDPRIFSLLAKAAGLQRAVKITYLSMNEPAPHERIISPHSIVRAGRRWHVRAFCSKNQQFRDYSLGRISEATLLDAAAEQIRCNDVAWMTEVPVRLMAHPKLSPEQEQVIRFKYFRGTMARVTTCRAALISYFIQDVRAALDPDKQLPPDYQLVVENIKEIKPWIFQR